MRVLLRTNPGDLFFSERVGRAHSAVFSFSPPPSTVAEECIAAFLDEYAACVVGEAPPHNHVLIVRQVAKRKTIDPIAYPAEDSIE